MTILPALSWSMVGICEPKVSLFRPPPISATQFIGSIVAWARNGKSKLVSTTAPSSGLAMSPCVSNTCQAALPSGVTLPEAMS